jgi:hypothetical protein
VGTAVSDVTAALAEHWNGWSWQEDGTLGPAHDYGAVNYFNAVTATSHSNAWAVGFYSNPSSASQTLIARWSGADWLLQKSPDPGTASNGLSGVTATSARNAWAVGSYRSGPAPDHVLILHWNGSSWTQQSSPSPGSSDLLAVTAASPASAWAVGDYQTSTKSGPLIEHWNGAKWKLVSSPPAPGGVLRAVDAVSASDVWAVGDEPKNSRRVPLIEHWNGAAWKVVSSPSLTGSSNLTGVIGTSASNGWAVGWNTSGTSAKPSTLLLHWNGTRWARVAAPNPGALFAIAAGSPSDIWAVGVGVSGQSALALHCC